MPNTPVPAWDRVAASAVADKLLALNPQPVLVLADDSGTILDMNPAAEAMFGFDRSDFLGVRFATCFRQSKDAEHILADRVEYVALQYLVISGDRHLPVQITLRRLDEIGVLLVFLRDMSSHLALDNQRMIALRNYNLLFDSSPLPMLFLDRDRFVVSANRAAQALYRVSGSGLEQLRFSTFLVNPMDLEGYQFQLDTMRLQPHWHQRPDDTRFLVEVTLSTLRQDHQTFLLLVLHDVTESVRQLDDLRHAEERWRFALEGHGEGVWEWMPKTGEASVSGRYLEMLGFGHEDALRPFEYWEARVHPDDMHRLQMAIIQHFLGETPLIASDYRMMTIDGRYRWVETRARVIEYGEKGQPLRLVGTLRDIHELRQQELREQQQKEQLMHTARLATIGELVSMITHEVTQPLTAISNYAAVARRHVARAGMDVQLSGAVQALERISEQVGHAGEVVHRIRSFVKKGKMKTEALSVNTLLLDVMRLAEIQARALSVEIELDLAPDLPEIRGDRMQLSQLLLNLAHNGLEAMTSVRGARRLLLRSLRNVQGEVEIQVADCGCGLSPALALDVITPFFTTKVDGLGMGLAICQSVVENHHGRLWANPAMPAGTVFHVSLPVG